MAKLWGNTDLRAEWTTQGKVWMLAPDPRLWLFEWLSVLVCAHTLTHQGPGCKVCCRASCPLKRRRHEKNLLLLTSGNPIRAFPQSHFILEVRRTEGLHKAYKQMSFTAFRILIQTGVKPICRFLWLSHTEASPYRWFLFKPLGIFPPVYRL